MDVASCHIMLLLLMLTTVHCWGDWGNLDDGFTDNEIFIQCGHFGMYVYQAEEAYHVFLKKGTNESYFSIEELGHWNSTMLPPLLQKFLSPPPINREPLQLCYDFTTERLSLKIVIGALALIFLVSHGSKITTLGRDLLQSELTRRLSRRRSAVAGGTPAHTSLDQEARTWFSESPETLHQTSTI